MSAAASLDARVSRPAALLLRDGTARRAHLAPAELRAQVADELLCVPSGEVAFILYGDPALDVPDTIALLHGGELHGWLLSEPELLDDEGRPARFSRYQLLVLRVAE